MLCDRFIEDKENSKKGGPLFDIVAGTSIGAMNGAVFISIVNRNKTWKEAVIETESFGQTRIKACPPILTLANGGGMTGNLQNKVEASDDARRKYYSVKEYLTHGTPRVCTPPGLKGYDKKFGDQKDNLWFYHKSDPLEHTIVKYSTDQNNNKKMKIVTSREQKQPRLLVISVDVAEGKTITFDSYHKEAEDPKNTLYEGDGITIDHIMASGTLQCFTIFENWESVNSVMVVC